MKLEIGGAKALNSKRLFIKCFLLFDTVVDVSLCALSKDMMIGIMCIQYREICFIFFN